MTVDVLTILQFLGRSRLRRHARHYLRSVHEQNRLNRPPLVDRSAPADVSASIKLGVDGSGHPIMISPQDFRTHGLILGASGSGKSCAATSAVEQTDGSVGTLDCKGETYSWLSARRLGERRPVLLDFAGSAPVPYALLKPRSGENAERLVERRMEAFDDLLGSDGHLSLRMSRMLRNLLLLMIENDLPFPLIELLFARSDIAANLAGKSPDGRLRDYFGEEFGRERQTTQLALSARLDSILRHQNLRLSFGSPSFVDFREQMDCGAVIHINAGGPTLPRSHTRLIQSLIVSDIRQAVFERRERQRPFTWLIDEAQCLFGQPSDTENVSTLLSMSRSFGVNLVLITQSLAAATPSTDFLTSVDTNFRWLLLFRCGPKDAVIIEPALPVSGRVVRQRYGKGQISYLTASQEIAERVRHIANLPSRHAYFWLRGAGSLAVPLTVRSIQLSRSVQQPSSQDGAVSAYEIQQSLQQREQQLRDRVDPLRPGARRGKHRVDDVIAALERDLVNGVQ